LSSEGECFIPTITGNSALSSHVKTHQPPFFQKYFFCFLELVELYASFEKETNFLAITDLKAAV